MKRVSAIGLGVSFLLVLAALTCGNAAPIVVATDPMDLTQAPWLNAFAPAHAGAGWATLTEPDGSQGGNPSPSLGINVGAAGVQDYIYTTDADFTGDYSTWMADAYPNYVTFDFYSPLQAGPGVAYPSSLELYFWTGSGNYDWRYTFTVTGLSQGWNSLLVFLDYGAGWYAPISPMYGETEFFQALQNVTEIGIVLGYHTGFAGQEYGLDNFQLGYVIPEPGTYAALAAAFMSLGIAFRGKLREVLGNVKGLLGRG